VLHYTLSQRPTPTQRLLKEGSERGAVDTGVERQRRPLATIALYHTLIHSSRKCHLPLQGDNLD
jgi:hypothetical protein